MLVMLVDFWKELGISRDFFCIGLIGLDLIVMLQGYATITILPNNFENGWIGFDGSSTHVVTSINSSQPVVVTIRRESSTSLGRLTVSIQCLCDKNKIIFDFRNDLPMMRSNAVWGNTSAVTLWYLLCNRFTGALWTPWHLDFLLLLILLLCYLHQLVRLRVKPRNNCARSAFKCKIQR